MGTRVRLVAAIGAALIGVIVAVYLGVVALFVKRVVTPAKRPAEPLTVREVRQGQAGTSVVLSRGEDACLPGKYSFIFDGGSGHAKLGNIIAQGPHSVERVVLQQDSGSLSPGAQGRISGWWYASPQELGYPVEDVVIRSEFGDFPAWSFTPRGAQCGAVAIHVHGRGAHRAETLRGVDAVAKAGWGSLVISYRNDVGAPLAEDGKYGFGLVEADDVIAAIEYAVAEGAQQILLFGWSMGATAVLRATELITDCVRISGIILESPAIDWPSILVHQAQRAGLPRAIGHHGSRLIAEDRRLTGLSASIEVTSLRPERWAATLEVPVLIHASNEDTFVPNDGALRLASLRPDLVTLRNVEHGEHVKIWNFDPETWEQTTCSFARTLLDAESQS